MSKVFTISDTHFGHSNILKFEHEGKPLRPFNSLTEMHVCLIDNWNSVVTPKDKVYHLGDVAWGAEGLKIMGLLNGKKRLVRGNHDLLKTRKYLGYFSEVYGVRQINGVWFTHVPMHPDSLGERVRMNYHGHTHARRIVHPKLTNVSVEAVNYTPVEVEL